MGHYADDREKISEIKNRGFYNGGKAMSETKGRVTIPTDLDVIPETLKMLDEWGADAIRDCDGTEFPAELKKTGAKIYATYYTTRKDNAWAKAHPEEIQQMYIMTSFHTAVSDTLEIHLMDHLYPDMLAVNTRDDIRRWWEVIDRTTGEVVSTEEWSYDEKNGNVVMINHFIYNIKDPLRGDIAAFQKDGDERYFVKRIVGLPGETVQIKEGKLLIDGKPLKAEYVSDIGYAGTASEPVHLGKDEYFLLGDNETASDDSREEKIGNIKKKEIYGEVWFVIKPWSDIGFVSD